MKKILFYGIVVFSCSLFFAACVRDTNFDQIEEITLTPIVEFDAIYFDLPANRFFDSITSTPILTVTDTTKIKFLDDEFLRNNLKRLEFYFKFTNSIPNDFQVDFQFLSEANDIAYDVRTSVLPGTLDSPVITALFENIAEQDILRITQANKLVVLVTIASADDNLEGTLNLKSKGTYFLEY